MQFVLQRAVQQGHFGQECLLEERQAVGHFVDHVELLEPQHAGLPEREHRTADRFVVGGLLLRRQAGAFACLQQPFDLHLEVAHALALDFRRVRRQHRHDHAVAEESRQRLQRDPGGLDAIERPRQAAVGRRVAIDLGLSLAATVVQVFREVGEVREVTERARDDHRLLATQSVEDAFELAPGRGVFVAVERDGALSHALHHVVRGAAFLVANRVAEQAAEQANVVPQRTVRLVVELHGYGLSRANGSATSGTSSCTSRSNGRSRGGTKSLGNQTNDSRMMRAMPGMSSMRVR